METMPKESSAPVGKTWMPTAAGILSIIAGSFNILFGILVTCVGGLTTSIPGHMWEEYWHYSWDYPWSEAFWGMWAMWFLWVIGVLLIVIGIIAIIGGVFALRRRVWGMALAGAILALFPPPISILGILSIIFLAISRNEFNHT